MRLNAENLKASEPVNAPTHARESKTGANAKNTPTRVRHLCQNAPARARERPNPDLTRPNSSSTAPCNEAQCHANNLANTKKNTTAASTRTVDVRPRAAELWPLELRKFAG